MNIHLLDEVESSKCKRMFIFNSYIYIYIEDNANDCRQLM